MDLNPDGSGRLPLQIFWSHPKNTEFHFTESAEYLRQIGASEESGSGIESVLIANYVTGASNCIASSRYYSVCCIDVCHNLLNEIEGVIQKSTAQPRTLLDLAENLESPTVDAPRNLSDKLVQRLHSIADGTTGEVHLHGRLFAQWLHYAFPNDCPYPHVVEDATKTSPSYYHADKAKHNISAHEKTLHEQQVYVQDIIGDPISSGKWSDDEIL